MIKRNTETTTIYISFAEIVWISLILTLAIFGFILHKLSLKSKPLNSTFIDLIALLVSQGVSHTSYKISQYCSVSCKFQSFCWFYRLLLVLQILFITWLFFAFLIAKHYESSMTASLTIPHKSPDINTIEELLKSNLQYAMTAEKVNRNRSIVFLLQFITACSLCFTETSSVYRYSSSVFM